MSDGQIRSVEDSAAYLASPEAAASLARDPYWPKWHSPWWHIVLLWELGRADAIPAQAAEAMTRAIDAKYLRFMPLTKAELPPGKDEGRDVACHCALGVMAQALQARGIAVRERLPWFLDWFLRYQLPDGGWNCEAEAYSGSRKSSMLSTVAVLEALLVLENTDEERACADRAAGYLIAHRLVRATTGEVIDPEWLKLCFPRFYDYDILRGLNALRRWARKRGRSVPPDAVADAADLLAGRPLIVGRDALARASLVPTDAGWVRGAATRFPLLDAVSRVGAPAPALRVE